MSPSLFFKVNRYMAQDLEQKHKKKSQKRVDRQARKAEKRKQKELLEKNKLKKQQSKPIKARLSKKSLPGFLAKNTDAIIQWLKDYQTLFVMADDYGIQSLDRLSDEKRHLLVQNYVDVGEFITTLEEIKNSQLSSQELSSDKIESENEQYDELSTTSNDLGESVLEVDSLL